MKNLKLALASLAVMATLGTSGQLMAKPCETNITFKTVTTGENLKLDLIRSRVAGNLIQKWHNPASIALTNGGTANVRIKFAQKCQRKRSIEVVAKDSSGQIYCDQTGTMGKGVMNFGTVNLVKCRMNKTFTLGGVITSFVKI